ncbi:GNAT family N-acetyltransferase [Taibaiella koreensis]|uniref:GNAT family N-acetyltransferase n=1 Tax=Taibaiella koreensis TaxID=1268548 RepID=UPI000E59F701|nr:GNAT family N-acetyltransferase [Taibaiella koreensis]
MTTPGEPLFDNFSFGDYLFSAEKSRIDMTAIHAFLDKESYWARGIPYETVVRAIQGSVCIGIYDPEGQLAGFGRMITDRATFAYLADIFVLKTHRGKGLSKELMKVFCQLADRFGLRRFLLTTQDAHDLYRRSGFELFPYPERLMSRPGLSYQHNPERQ